MRVPVTGGTPAVITGTWVCGSELVVDRCLTFIVREEQVPLLNENMKTIGFTSLPPIRVLIENFELYLMSAANRDRK